MTRILNDVITYVGGPTIFNGGGVEWVSFDVCAAKLLVTFDEEGTDALPTPCVIERRFRTMTVDVVPFVEGNPIVHFRMGTGKPFRFPQLQNRATAFVALNDLLLGPGLFATRYLQSNRPGNGLMTMLRAHIKCVAGSISVYHGIAAGADAQNSYRMDAGDEKVFENVLVLGFYEATGGASAVVKMAAQIPVEMVGEYA